MLDINQAILNARRAGASAIIFSLTEKDFDRLREDVMKGCYDKFNRPFPEGTEGVTSWQLEFEMNPTLEESVVICSDGTTLPIPEV